MAAHGAELNAAHAWSLTVDPSTICEGLIDADVAASFPTAGDLQKLCRRTLAYTDYSDQAQGAEPTDRKRTISASRWTCSSSADRDPRRRH